MPTPDELWNSPGSRGHGEVLAIPVLIRRLIAELDRGVEILIARPLRVPRDRLIHRAGELERVLELAAARLSGTGAVFVLLDSDGECPASMSADLLDRARAARADLTVSVVIAHQEFEAWFLAADGHPNPEAVRGAKEWLTERMPMGTRYSPTRDQVSIAQSFDLTAARRAPSFDKFVREVMRLCELAREHDSSSR